MKQFNGYNDIDTTEREKLPVGGYIGIIKAAEVRTYKCKDGGTFDKLEIAFDVAEGEYKNFYHKDFSSNPSEDKKWKGVLRQYLPTDDGSEQDGKTKFFFKLMIEAIEESNSGYHWNWDEKTLKGKKVGVIFRNEEYDYNGYQGWSAKPFKFVSVEKIKSGKFTIPKDKPLNNSTATSAQTSNVRTDDIEEITDDDLPF